MQFCNIRSAHVCVTPQQAIISKQDSLVTLLTQTYRAYQMHNFFSIKFAYEKYILHRNKQSFQNKIHLGQNHTGPTICIIFSLSNLHMKNTFYTATGNHFKKRFTWDTGKQPPHYNKCWNLEILQDNSKALAGRCLEEWVTTL